MDKFVVTGIPAFNGEYPVDIGAFTMRELQIIKRMSGVRAGELEEAFAAGDSSLVLALAVIAVRRNGKKWEDFEQLAWESEMGQITFMGEEEVAEEAAPLTSEPNANPDAPQPPSGEHSQTVGDDSQATNLRAIGSQG
jgi:hypothetical protein